MKKHYIFKRLWLLFVALVLQIGVANVAVAQNAIYSCDFSASSSNYTTGIVGANQIVNGDYIPQHTNFGSYGHWNRISSNTALDSYTYPVLYSYFSSMFTASWSENTTFSNGFMLMSMIDNYSAWGGDGDNGIFDAYIALSPFSTVGHNLVKICFRQLYRKFNHDKCYVDYSTDGITWSSVEINVKNIDVNVNSTLYGLKESMLPLAVANQSNVYLRLRYVDESTSDDVAQGSSGGYFWAVDDIEIVDAPTYDIHVVHNTFLNNYGQIPQGLQLPITYTSRIENTGSNTLSNLMATVKSAGNTLVSDNGGGLGLLEGKTLIIDGSGYFTDTVNEWSGGNPFNSGIQYTGITMGSIATYPSATIGQNSVMAYTSMSNSLSTDTLSFDYTVNWGGSDQMGVWAWDHGTFYPGRWYNAYMISSNIFSTDTMDGVWNQTGYITALGFRTGSNIPAGWVVRGVELVTTSVFDATGAMLSPVLMERTDNGLQNVTTGAGIHTVTSAESNYSETDTLATGYKTIRIMFPDQPDMESNRLYYLGYRLENDATFMLAGEYGQGNKLGSYDIFSYYETYNQIKWIRDNNNKPMIRMLVGPRVYIPKYPITFTCPTGYQFDILNNNSYFTCGDVDSVTSGSTVTYYVYSSNDEPLIYNNVYVNGSPIPFTTYTYTNDNEEPRNYILFTLDNVSEACNVTFSVSHVGPIVTINGPVNVRPGDSATFTASVTNDNNSTITWTLQGTTPSTATGSSVSATWNSVGTYDVIATATNAYGSSSDTLQVMVSYISSFSYCGADTFWSYVTAGANYYWGIMLPSSLLSDLTVLQGVQLYVSQPDNYILQIYQGGSTAPGTLVYSQNYSFVSATNQYETCILTTPLTIDTTQNLWVIFYSYSAPICSYNGNPNGTWLNYDGSWLDGSQIVVNLSDGSTSQFSWMLRCLFNSEPRVTINGPASVAAGTPATFTATTIPQTVPVSWTLQGATPSTASGDTVTATWSNAGTYNVIATAVVGGTSVADTLVLTVMPSYQVAISCTGTGGGVSQLTYDYDGNHCGQTDHYVMGFYASYDFIADEGSDLTHLYVNNVDRINDVYANWYSGTSVSTFEFQVFENTTINAVFDARVYHVDATSSDASMGYVTGGGNYFYDSIATITAIPMPHYQFSYWDIIYYGDSIMWPENPIVFNVFDDISIVAHFEPEVYTITVAPNNVNAGAVTGGGTFEYLEPVNLTATAYSGYRFLMWNNGITYNPYTFPATEDLDLVAVFVEDNDTTQYFSITANVNDATMGTVSGGGVFMMGDVATLEATAYEGFHFAQWQDGNIDNPRQITVLGNASYTAYFAPNQGVTYMLTATSADESMGYVTGGGIYTDGAIATLTAIPYDGFEFDHWQDNETENPRSVTVTSDAEYVAYFRPLDGVETVDSQVGLRIYPNPATDVATIALSGISGNVSLKVVDLNGRTVALRAFECDGGCMTVLEVEGLAPGAYFVQVVTNDAVIVKKLIVK